MLFNSSLAVIAGSSETYECNFCEEQYEAKPKPKGSGFENQTLRVTHSSLSLISGLPGFFNQYSSSIGRLSSVLSGLFLCSYDFLISQNFNGTRRDSGTGLSTFSSAWNINWWGGLFFMLMAIFLLITVLSQYRRKNALQRRLLEQSEKLEMLEQKLDAQEINLRIKKVEITSFLRSILESFISTAEQKNISLDFKFPTRQYHLMADPEKLEKIMASILSNAIKFTPAKGSINLRLTLHENKAEIQIMDTGRGIDKDRLPNIFDRFNSTSGQNRDEKEGLGLSLHLTKKYVELHEGSITVESKLGMGTIFTIFLPYSPVESGVVDEEKRPEKLVPSDYLEKTQDASRLPNHSAKVKILVVEDNREMRNYISDILKREKFLVETAENGTDGKRKLFLTNPDLIITDIRMPEVDGFELINYVRSVPEFYDTPIIIISAKTEVNDRIYGFQIGISDYLTKPFNDNELKARIHNLIKFKKEREKQSEVPEDEAETFSHEKVFVNQLKEYVEQNITNTNISTELLSEAVNLSRRQLYRRLNKATGFTPAVFVREIRFLRSRHLLEQKEKQTIAEVAYSVGFSNPSHFSRLFKQRFGILPSKYLSR
ncbi:MAG: response regulator [Balneolales bacterium]